jgi:hypothetical protein
MAIHHHHHPTLSKESVMSMTRSVVTELNNSWVAELSTEFSICQMSVIKDFEMRRVSAKFGYVSRLTNRRSIAVQCARNSFITHTCTNYDNFITGYNLLSNGYQGSFHRGQGVKLTTHLHLVRRLIPNVWSYTSTPQMST